MGLRSRRFVTGCLPVPETKTLALVSWDSHRLITVYSALGHLNRHRAVSVPKDADGQQTRRLHTDPQTISNSVPIPPARILDAKASITHAQCSISGPAL